MLSLIVAAALVQGPSAGRKLIWFDEFSGKGLPEASRWSYEVGRVRNNEDQFYTQARLENARQEGGNLVIEARREPWQGAQVTSASVTSKESWKNVFIEVRAK